LLPPPPLQAVSPSESAAATAAYFITARRFITTPLLMADAIQPTTDASLHLLLKASISE
jgi:hypothetical protein